MKENNQEKQKVIPELWDSYSKYIKLLIRLSKILIEIT